MFTTEELGIISDALYEWEDNFNPKIEPKVIEAIKKLNIKVIELQEDLWLKLLIYISD